MTFNPRIYLPSLAFRACVSVSYLVPLHTLSPLSPSSFLVSKSKVTMYRSASWNRVSDDYFIHSSSPSSKTVRLMSSTLDGNDHQLPMLDPVTELAKRERARVKFAENAVHVIPFVLFLCAIILWFFSNPDVEIGNKGESVAAKIEGLTVEGEFDNDSDGTQTGVLPIMDSGDIDSLRELETKVTSSKRPDNTFE